jgi:U3 small nucleolar RNA-associated protein 23
MQIDRQNMSVADHERKTETLKDLPRLSRPPPEKSIFRRNRAKGPNPLSVRKKKQKAAAGAGAAAGKLSVEEEATKKAKRKRIRKRKAGDSKAAAQAVDQH